MTHLYLDHAATTPMREEVVDAMLPYMREHYGNASSVHALGQDARAAINDARDQMAAVLRCEAREIFFTSGGTEADNLALRGTLQRHADRGRHIIVSAIEHDAVLNTADLLQAAGMADVTVVPCGRDGLIDPQRVAAAVRDDTVLVSVMLANNEVGTIQDIAAISQLVKGRNADTLVHTDAVQALGKIPVDVQTLGVDMLSVSGHKVYGPKGIGALFIRHGVALSAQMTGGPQERNRRAGTENVPAIVGLAVAATCAERERAHEMPRLQALSNRLMQGIVNVVEDCVATGSAHQRLPTFATFAIAGARTDLLLARLDAMGVYASGGSACGSGAPTPSHVLHAMGYPENLATGALRCTLGRGIMEGDINRAIAAIDEAIRHIRGAVADSPMPVS